MGLTKEEKRRKARLFLSNFATRDNWLVLDTETTGPDAEDDEIVEIGLITSQGETVFDSLVKPKGEISEGAQEVHGIGPEDVADAPPITEIGQKLRGLLITQTVLIYNRAFDGPIIENSFRRRGVEVDWTDWDLRCVMEAYAMGYGEWDDYHESYSWVKLEQACRDRDVTFAGTDLHRAAGDAELTRRLVRSFAEDKQENAEPELDFG